MKNKNLIIGCALMSLLIIVNCEGDSGTTPQPVNGTGDVSTPSIISIKGLPVVILSPRETHQLVVEGYDANGDTISEAFQVNWRSEDQTRVTINTEGLISAVGVLGNTWIFVESDSLQDSVAVWVQKPLSEESTFEIKLYFSEEVPDWWRTALTSAAAKWKWIIRDKLPPVDIAAMKKYCSYDTNTPPDSVLEGIESGVRVYVYAYEDSSSESLFEVVGGPCINRGLPFPTTVLGRIILSKQRLKVRPLDINYLAQHEMGHVLGLVGLVQGFQPNWLDRQNNRYLGHLGLFGHYWDTRELVSELPFPNSAHWPMPGLMGSPRSNHIRNATIGALMDLGYPAAWY